MYLNFEKKIEEKEKKIDELKTFIKDKKIENLPELEKLEKDLKSEIKKTYKNLNPWQKTQVARHPNRPYVMDYINKITTNFVELHGDRLFRDDGAIVGGIAKIDDQPIVIIGTQKGRNLEENLERNFGMPHPEGYRKALRLMKMASQFNLPIINLIDTSGAFPGIGAEERGQGEAIAQNLLTMFDICSPIISIIIGEGGSGGALALGVANKVLMLEHSIYSVISPEGAATILFKDYKKVEESSKNLKLTSADLLELGIIEKIIKEPIGGAHRDYEKITQDVKKEILIYLKELLNQKPAELKRKRYERFRKIDIKIIKIIEQNCSDSKL